MIIISSGKKTQFIIYANGSENGLCWSHVLRAKSLIQLYHITWEQRGY